MNRRKATATLLIAGLISPLGQAAPDSQIFLPTTLASGSAQDSAQGFFEGQSLKGTTRNFWANVRSDRNTYFAIPKPGGTFKPTRRADTWVQGTILEYSSGFTQGIVGFSLQAAVYNQLALERRHDRIAGGVNRTLVDSDGDAVGQWSKLGLGNFKARISNTVLTLGRQNVYTPVLTVNEVLSLPSSFQGVTLHSEELSNLAFDLGTYDRISPYTQQSLRRFRTEYGDPSVDASHVDMAGLVYQPTSHLKTSLYTSRVRDLWNQHYLSAEYHMGDASALELTSTLSYYRTRDTGASKLGPIDNDTYSLEFSLNHLGHTLKLGYQEVGGNEFFDYLGETDAIYLANTLLTDFNGPNEKSIAVSYGVDMAQYAVPGMTLMVYTAWGWGIDGTHYTGSGYDVRAMDNEKHVETGLVATYTVQSGTLKDTQFFFLYGINRASENQVDGTMTETRLVTTIPFQLF
ncbi:OprD family outer membrane porin [Pseudomonas sp. Z1-12]|uniref:OprD family outer membrane porin n=1 Tax=Pseudomonas sp. Z1-12 TaxID=2817408 RepID=UPI003DA9B8AD